MLNIPQSANNIRDHYRDTITYKNKQYGWSNNASLFIDSIAKGVETPIFLMLFAIFNHCWFRYMRLISKLSRRSYVLLHFPIPHIWLPRNFHFPYAMIRLIELSNMQSLKNKSFSHYSSDTFYDVSYVDEMFLCHIVMIIFRSVNVTIFHYRWPSYTFPYKVSHKQLDYSFQFMFPTSASPPLPPSAFSSQEHSYCSLLSSKSFRADVSNNGESRCSVHTKRNARRNFFNNVERVSGNQSDCSNSLNVAPKVLFWGGFELFAFPSYYDNSFDYLKHANNSS